MNLIRILCENQEREGINIKPKKIRVGIFTDNYDKAKFIFDILELAYKNDIQFYKENRYQPRLNLRTIKDEIDFVWLKPIDMSRGYRCSRAYIDNNIDREALNTIVMLICMYCDEDDIVYFD